MLTQVLVYVSYFLILSFVLICVAAGLYFMTEFVEENVILAKRIIKYVQILVMVSHFLILFAPTTNLYLWCYSIIAPLLFTPLLHSFPMFTLSSITFILPFAWSLINHFLWFYHSIHVYYPFEEMLAHFTILVWLLPFLFIISLSVNDNTLPNHAPSSAKKNRLNLFTFLKFIFKPSEPARV